MTPLRIGSVARVFLGLALWAQFASAEEPLQAGSSDRFWVLESQGDTGTLRSVDSEITLRPGSHVEFSDLRASGDTWLATGSRATVTGGSELFLIAGDLTGQRELPLGFGASDSQRSSPVLIVDASDASRTDSIALAGLAWLEGSSPRRHEVRFAGWNGRGLLDPTVISPSGISPSGISPTGQERRVARGSQIALQAASLPDGSALLVWSAFDGEDDEILWSQGSSSGWSAPQRLHEDNQMPDITPAISIDNGQPIIAWSRYDGNDYRLVIASLEGDQWSEIQSVGGRGSLYPRWIATRETQILLFFEADQRNWRALQVAALGGRVQIGAGAAIPGSGSSRPMVLDADGRGVTFRFSGSNAATLGSRTALWNR